MFEPGTAKDDAGALTGVLDSRSSRIRSRRNAAFSLIAASLSAFAFASASAFCFSSAASVAFCFASRASALASVFKSSAFCFSAAGVAGVYGTGG